MGGTLRLDRSYAEDPIMILETLSLTVRPQPSGEPDAGKPPVRFGGRGDLIQSSLPLSIIQSLRDTRTHPYRFSRQIHGVP
jgi:hypothetical protein